MSTSNHHVLPIAEPSQHCDEVGIPHVQLPIVDGIPKLLFTDAQVASMLGVSVATVRNRYSRKSRFFDPRFPLPRTTDGRGGTRKAAVRWHWLDLLRYASGLPTVTDARQLHKRVVDTKTLPKHLVAGTDFVL